MEMKRKLSAGHLIRKVIVDKKILSDKLNNVKKKRNIRMKINRLFICCSCHDNEIETNTDLNLIKV